MRGKVTVDEWKSCLDSLKIVGATHISDESVKKGRMLLKDFIEFTNPNGRVLDIGCGSGDYGRYSRFEGYIGVDPIEYHTRDFPFVRGVGEYLPFKDMTVDCIVTMAALDHCLNPEHVMAESKRVLKKHGKLFIWLQVVRTSSNYKIRRLLHYLKTLNFFELARSIRSNINLSITRKSDIEKYGHTQLFTEKNLLELVSKSFRILRIKWHDQNAFIVAEK